MLTMMADMFFVRESEIAVCRCRRRDRDLALARECGNLARLTLRPKTRARLFRVLRAEISTTGTLGMGVHFNIFQCKALG